MGCPLPGDDKDFIASYGSGNIGDYLWVRNPFSASEDVNLVAFAHDQLDALRERRADGELVPYPLYPEPGGLLPWATLFDGAVCSWVTGGDPEGWTVAVNESRGSQWSHFPGSMSELLVGLLTGTVALPAIPRLDLSGGPPRFQPEPDGGEP